MTEAGKIRDAVLGMAHLGEREIARVLQIERAEVRRIFIERNRTFVNSPPGRIA